MSFLPGGDDYRLASGDPRQSYVTKAIPTTRPRAVLEVYGLRVLGTMFEITDNAHGVASTAQMTVPAAGGPDWSAVLKTPTTKDGAVVVRIYAGFPSDPVPGSTDIAQLVPRFVGIVNKDDVKAAGDTWTFDCTSLATLLSIEKETTLTQNMTTVQFVRAACAAAGLPAPDIRLRPGQSPLPLRLVMSQDFVLGVHNYRAENLIAACAADDGVEFWVDRLTGVPHYVAPTLESRAIYDFEYGVNLTDFNGEHSPQYAKNIKVEVRLWNTHTTTSHTARVTTGPDGTATMQTSTRVTSSQPSWGTSGSTSITYDGQGNPTSQTTHSSSGGLFNTGKTVIERASSAQTYTYELHDASPAEANALAIARWRSLSRFEYTAKIDTPVTPELLAVLNLNTVFRVKNVPWQAFNTVATSLTPGQVASQPVGSNSPDAPYYFQRRTVERMEIGQGDSSESPGYTMSSEVINHAIPSGAAI